MADDNLQKRLESLAKRFDHFYDHPKLERFARSIEGGPLLDDQDLPSLYNHMVHISNHLGQKGAVVDGSLLKKIWRALEFLVRRNLELHKENEELKKRQESLSLLAKQLCDELSRESSRT